MKIELEFTEQDMIDLLIDRGYTLTYPNDKDGVIMARKHMYGNKAIHFAFKYELKKKIIGK